VHRLKALGVTKLHPRTTRAAVAILTHWETDITLKMPSYDDIYNDVQTFARNFPTAPAVPHGMPTYPTSPDDLPQHVFKAGYSDDDPPVASQLPRFRVIATAHIPLRNTSKLLARNAPTSRQRDAAVCARAPYQVALMPPDAASHRHSRPPLVDRFGREASHDSVDGVHIEMLNMMRQQTTRLDQLERADRRDHRDAGGSDGRRSKLPLPLEDGSVGDNRTPSPRQRHWSRHDPDRDPRDNGHPLKPSDRRCSRVSQTDMQDLLGESANAAAGNTVRCSAPPAGAHPGTVDGTAGGAKLGSEAADDAMLDALVAKEKRVKAAAAEKRRVEAARVRALKADAANDTALKRPAAATSADTPPKKKPRLAEASTAMKTKVATAATKSRAVTPKVATSAKAAAETTKDTWTGKSMKADLAHILNPAALLASPSIGAFCTRGSAACKAIAKNKAATTAALVKAAGGHGWSLCRAYWVDNK
jgi:hypothetical protein